MDSPEPFRLPDFSPRYDNFRLPDGSIPNPDLAVAIIYRSGMVLLLKNRGHEGFFILPGDYVGNSESPEAGCIRGAQSSIRQAVEELAAQLGNDEPVGVDLSISIVRKVATRCWRSATCHYFLATAEGESRILDPNWHPYIDPNRHKMGVWMPYRWVTLDAMSMTHLEPVEMSTVCQEALK